MGASDSDRSKVFQAIAKVERQYPRDYRFPYERAKFQMMYPNAKAYTDKVAQSADRLVKERWLTESDAKRIKQEAQARATK